VTLGTLETDNVYRFVQSILRKEGEHFLVAPYSAAAQVIYIISDTCPEYHLTETLARIHLFY